MTICQAVIEMYSLPCFAMSSLRATRATNLEAHCYSTTAFSGRTHLSSVPNGGEKRWAIEYLVTLQKPKVWTEGYAEECDSGVVVLDKGRLPRLMALLHICWQNSAEVRTQLTYRLTYGDKESWWFGLELCCVPFVFEDHYAAVLGQTEQMLVCSFSIAHVDELEKVLWYNGSLLKNKAVNLTDFLVSEAWMVNGHWIKGNTKADISCMRDSEVRDVQEDVKKIISDSIAVAQWLDKEVQHLGVDVVSDSDIHL